eukprot:TRINITY_DN11818_c0_g1_i1.p1 TRINITY_DN11818_c0_g1~~TRINITY_DN11818_c0_g1_i1.p1  ORF type:complete len:412 (+),score=124.95 TRINITY_DN11818_c0_g1_i1:108-1238(+)
MDPSEPAQGAAPLERIMQHDRLGALLCMKALWRYLRDALDHPEDVRYRIIDTRRPEFKQRVSSVPGAMDFLVEECGFRGDGDGRLIRPRLDSDAQRLQTQWTLDHLQACIDDFAPDPRLELQFQRTRLYVGSDSDNYYLAVQCVSLTGTSESFEIPLVVTERTVPLEFKAQPGLQNRLTQCAHGLEMTVELRKHHRLMKDTKVAFGKVTYSSGADQEVGIEAPSADPKTITVQLFKDKVPCGRPIGSVRVGVDSALLRVNRSTAQLVDRSSPRGESDSDDSAEPGPPRTVTVDCTGFDRVGVTYKGNRITKLVPEHPAASSGMQLGDRITAVAGRTVSDDAYAVQRAFSVAIGVRDRFAVDLNGGYAAAAASNKLG